MIGFIETIFTEHDRPSVSNPTNHRSPPPIPVGGPAALPLDRVAALGYLRVVMGDAPSTARPRLALPASPLPASRHAGEAGRGARPLATPARHAACRGDDAHVSAGAGRY